MTTDAEREAQKAYWKEHSENATVEAMMLDSKAADIDKLERPEVRSGRWGLCRPPIQPSAADPAAATPACLGMLSTTRPARSCRC
jgi:hypothetical protein